MDSAAAHRASQNIHIWLGVEGRFADRKGNFEPLGEFVLKGIDEKRAAWAPR